MNKLSQILCLLGLVALFLLSNSCNLNNRDPKPEFYNISVISGEDQLAVAGMPLRDPILILVTNERGRGIPNQKVSISQTGTSTTVSNNSDEDGIARLEFKMDSTEGEQTYEINLDLVENSCNNCPYTISFNVDAPEENKYELVFISGDNQTGTIDSALEEPIIVMVKDRDGLPVSSEAVIFSSISGNSGEDSTDKHGVAFFNWILGPEKEEQELKIELRNLDSCEVDKCTLYVTAEAIDCLPTFEDERDGQIYSAKLIGKQCWMTKNLNYGVFKYDSDSLNSGNGIVEKYCYDNKPELCDQLGGWYTWEEAVNHTKTSGKQGICPKDWHIPIQAEWDTLIVSLGIPDTALKMGFIGGCEFAEKLKKKGTGPDSWCFGCSEQSCESCVDCRGKSGFDALAAGSYIYDGNNEVWKWVFRGIKDEKDNAKARFWSATASSGSPNTAWTYLIDLNAANGLKHGVVRQLFSFGGRKKTSYSIRCVKD